VNGTSHVEGACNAVDGVRCVGQPSRSVYLLLPLRAQHNRALRVEESFRHDAVHQPANVQHCCRQLTARNADANTAPIAA